MRLVYRNLDGNIRIVADDVKDENEALEFLLKDQRQRFIYQTGKIKIKKMPKYFSFENAAGEDSGYRLEI